MGSDPIRANARAVDRHLLSRIRGNPGVLYEAAAHLIRHGGKRLRPFMAAKSCQMLGGSPRKAVVAAGAVEMIHNFTLVHDDIMDNDDVRHGVPTVHKKYGEPLAILAGDVLFSKAFHSVASQSAIPPGRSMELLSRLSKACVEVCEGQVMDIGMAQSRRIPSRAEYLSMVGKKTAALFDVSCAMGAICAGGGGRAADVSGLSSFGRNLGIAFQITDDLIGVMGDPGVTKKPVGNDLREGKKSLPILMAIDAASGADKRAILGCFGNPGAGKRDLRRAVDAVRELGIEESVRREALKYARRAQGSLDGCTVGGGGAAGRRLAKKQLASVLDTVVRRTS